MSSVAPLPSLEADLRELQTLIEQRSFADALASCDRLLEQFPGHRDLLYMRAVALRHLQRVPEALATLEILEDTHPTYPRLFQERGHCHVFLKQAPEAIRAFSRAVELNPALPASWRLLASLYQMVGRTQESANAAQHVAKLATLATEVVTARSMLADGNLREAEDLIRGYLRRQPDDIEALRVLAQVAHQNEFSKDAATLLEAVLEASPGYRAARHDYVLALIALHRHQQAREQIEMLIAAEPDHPTHRMTLASILVGEGSTEAAIALYGELARQQPGNPELHLSLGHALKTQGRREDAERAYREAARQRANFGDAYWSLANLKTYRFADAQLATMREQVDARRTPLVDRYHLCFALGKALEDRGEYAESFQFYSRGNALKKAECSYRPEALERTVGKQIELCTREFFAQRQGYGCDDPSPIFIVGLPRAGSTLLEQILASHSQVEGTMELADIPRLVSALDLHASGARYPGVLALPSADDYRGFGDAYLRDTRHYRIGNRPFFIDKMPNNFRHVSLIQLMLPNAKIIDARREPMACCFSNFKQLFASGQQFTYSLEDIGRYYALYVRLMDHWDSVLPGRVLRVQHEDVIDDLEGSVRRILDYCGLEFEAACVDFHKTERRVHTASSEQVRRPINREGVDQWKNFEPWLGPLREALGPLATT
ncbi:MAG: sulfotransferase [Gammaproteobacteria bacterium]|nr:sulfotransferase [Gammaproteobacteria bacterium]MDH5274299.1 sulfotransferase [Gammaproteobacteria bacterium]